MRPGESLIEISASYSEIPRLLGGLNQISISSETDLTSFRVGQQLGRNGNAISALGF